MSAGLQGHITTFFWGSFIWPSMASNSEYSQYITLIYGCPKSSRITNTPRSFYILLFGHDLRRKLLHSPGWPLPYLRNLALAYVCCTLKGLQFGTHSGHLARLQSRQMNKDLDGLQRSLVCWLCMSLAVSSCLALWCV